MYIGEGSVRQLSKRIQRLKIAALEQCTKNWEELERKEIHRTFFDRLGVTLGYKEYGGLVQRDARRCCKGRRTRNTFHFLQQLPEEH